MCAKSFEPEKILLTASMLITIKPVFSAGLIQSGESMQLLESWSACYLASYLEGLRMDRVSGERRRQGQEEHENVEKTKFMRRT